MQSWEKRSIYMCKMKGFILNLLLWQLSVFTFVYFSLYRSVLYKCKHGIFVNRGMNIHKYIDKITNIPIPI